MYLFKKNVMQCNAKNVMQQNLIHKFCLYNRNVGQSKNSIKKK